MTEEEEGRGQEGGGKVFEEEVKVWHEAEGEEEEISGNGRESEGLGEGGEVGEEEEVKILENVEEMEELVLVYEVLCENQGGGVGGGPGGRLDELEGGGRGVVGRGGPKSQARALIGCISLE